MNLFFTEIAYAASADDFILKVEDKIIGPLIEFLFALAILFFLFGVLQFLMNQENEEKKTAGKNHMIYGIIGITIMVGVWGIMNFILNSLGIKDQIDPQSGKVELR